MPGVQRSQGLKKRKQEAIMAPVLHWHKQHSYRSRDQDVIWQRKDVSHGSPHSSLSCLPKLDRNATVLELISVIFKTFL